MSRWFRAELPVLGLMLATSRSHAQIVAAEPEAPIVAVFPANVTPVETQVVLQLVIGNTGQVESAVVTSRLPANAPAAFDEAALVATRQARFHASMRDGRPIRSRIEYVVVFPPPGVRPIPAPTGVPAPPNVASTSKSASAQDADVLAMRNHGVTAPTAASATFSGKAPATNLAAPVSISEQDEDYSEISVQVHGAAWPSPRGIGDLRIKRELLDASPRQHTSEMLAAAPGFFVDHEDGEGMGNDVYLRGFDLEHGSGIEMRVGNVPINSPVHVQGQGYADANFIIPEVVRSIRVLEGPYDPRQGDAAIVGSAYFDLGIIKRGNSLKASYGSWNQRRIIGIAAPDQGSEETFVAFALRKTDGFGQNRASESGTLNAQYAFELGTRDHVRLLAVAYGARATLPGVVRQTDVNAGLIGPYDSYPYYSQNQGVQTSRVILGADFDHVTSEGARFEFAPWFMRTGFRARQNFSGNVYSSQLDPELAGGMGDLWETTNLETAMGVTSRFHATPLRVGSWLEVTTEPGVFIRAGNTDQAKSLLSPQTLSVWDRRLDDSLQTLDAGAYIDLDLHFWKRLRVSGGIRADLLSVTVNDRLGYDVPPAQATPGTIPGLTRSAQGVAVGPRVTLEYNLSPNIAATLAYGEGFRSLDASANVASSGGVTGGRPGIQESGRPFSKVSSYELGLRAATKSERYASTLGLFETHVANELVFEATSGGFTREGPSLRRGIVGSVLARPFDWLLSSVAMSVSSATFTTLVPGVSHYVPNVPPLLVRADVAAHRNLTNIGQQMLTGRFGIGYTFLSGRHLTEAIIGPSNHVLNANVSLRRGNVEIGVDAFNLLNLRYADDAEYYVSNWSMTPGTALAAPATHLSQAPPFAVLGTVCLYF